MKNRSVVSNVVIILYQYYIIYNIFTLYVAIHLSGVFINDNTAADNIGLYVRSVNVRY